MSVPPFIGENVTLTAVINCGRQVFVSIHLWKFHVCSYANLPVFKLKI